MQILPMGPTAVLLDEVVDPAGWAAAFARTGRPGVIDVVPAARTVLIVTDDERSLDDLVPHLEQIEVGSVAAASGRVVEIDVVYDGPDLVDVAGALGRSTDEIIELHSGATYRVAFCGFAPGFAYLTGLPTDLHLPRRATPRTRVPAGSVAIAAEYASVYPTESPGGWHLIGSARVDLFDVDRDPPALLTPGRSVRFVPA